jgi:hypothetical protein
MAIRMGSIRKLCTWWTLKIEIGNQTKKKTTRRWKYGVIRCSCRRSLQGPKRPAELSALSSSRRFVCVWPQAAHMRVKSNQDAHERHCQVHKNCKCKGTQHQRCPCDQWSNVLTEPLHALRHFKIWLTTRSNPIVIFTAQRRSLC